MPRVPGGGLPASRHNRSLQAGPFRDRNFIKIQMGKQVWYAITNLGDTSILLPCAVLIAFVLLLTASTRRLCVAWLAIVAVGEMIVATTKVLYMGWGLGIASLDFIGLSGHATLSSLVWPVAFALLLGRTDRWRIGGVALGILLASVIAVSRLEVHAHSVAEVVSGWILGTALSSVFLVRYRRPLHLVAPPRWLAVALILPLAIGYGRAMPTESILAAVARTLSGHSHVYTREDLHSGAFRNPFAEDCEILCAARQRPAERAALSQMACRGPGVRRARHPAKKTTGSRPLTSYRSIFDPPARSEQPARRRGDRSSEGGGRGRLTIRVVTLEHLAAVALACGALDIRRFEAIFRRQ